jgi:hypothetical protein
MAALVGCQLEQTIAAWNFSIRVRCFDRTGALVDTRFKVPQAGFGRDFIPFAFAWADQRSLTTCS